MMCDDYRMHYKPNGGDIVTAWICAGALVLLLLAGSLV